MAECDVVFICVPTPSKTNGKCFTGIVDKVISTLRDIIDEKKTFIVVRSTVPVGYCDIKDVYFMPEFLTEKSWKSDFKSCEDWVFGVLENKYIDNAHFMNLMNKMLHNAKFDGVIDNTSMHFIKTHEAECVKIFRNNALATKIGLFNEFESFCSAKNINYNKVKQIVTYDKRIGNYHTSVPGHDGKRGFGGTCLPKDLNSMIYQMTKSGLEAPILKAVKRRNNDIDRCERDWEDDVGRTIVNPSKKNKKEKKEKK